ncbi:MAG: flagellar export protein FliJ [Pseudobdellovibrio sp.]
MKFKFPLQKVLNHRQIQLDLAQKDYLEALNFYNEEQVILENLRVEREHATLQRGLVVNQTSDWQQKIIQINEYLVLQDVRIKQQNERLTKIEKVVEARREVLKQALSEVKIMERLKENKKQDFIQEVQKTENKELDEISTIRFVRMTKNAEE